MLPFLIHLEVFVLLDVKPLSWIQVHISLEISDNSVTSLSYFSKWKILNDSNKDRQAHLIFLFGDLLSESLLHVYQYVSVFQDWFV